LIKEKKLSKKEKATFAVYEKIKPLGEGVNRYEKPKLKLDLDSLDIDKINLRPLSNFTKEYVTGKLRFKPKTKIAYSQLIKGINNLNATQNFTIDYSLDKGKDGKDDLN
jgi:NTE family protein